MYINPQQTFQIFIENTSPPSMLISQKLIDQFSEEQLRFLLAKHLFYVACGQTLAYKLNARDLQVYLYIVRSCFVPPESISVEAESLQKKVYASLPRRTRKGLENRKDIWDMHNKMKVKYFLKCLEYSANRLAFALCDSLQLSVDMLYRIEQMQQGQTPNIAVNPDYIKHIEGVGDLLLYNISEKYGNLRKACAIDIK